MGRVHDKWERDHREILGTLLRIEKDIQRLESQAEEIGFEINEFTSEFSIDEYRAAKKFIADYERGLIRVKKLAPQRAEILKQVKVLQGEFNKLEKEEEQIARSEPDDDE